MKTNIQVCLEKARACYEASGQAPLLQQLCQVHNLSLREFASIFGISKSHAGDVVAHKVYPSLELAVRIARYWECTVEELFGWRIDDDGARRPLLIEDAKTHKVRRLSQGNRVGAIELVMESRNSGCEE